MTRARTFALALALAAVACSSHDVAPPAGHDKAPVAKARTDAGAPRDAAPTRYLGVIAAAESIDIAPLVQGVIADVKVRPGDEVKAGEVVVEMDPTSMQQALRAAEATSTAAAAAYREAVVGVEEARRKLALEKKAVADGISPKQNVDEAALAVKQKIAAAERAAADAAAARSQVETAREHVADTTLRSKFDGIVQLRFHDAGATVPAGQPIVRILGRAGLRLRFAVPPDQTRAIAAGTKVTATVETITAPVPAVVRQVSPALDPASGMIIVEAELTVDAAISAELRPGLAAWVPPP